MRDTANCNELPSEMLPVFSGSEGVWEPLEAIDFLHPRNYEENPQGVTFVILTTLRHSATL